MGYNTVLGVIDVHDTSYPVTIGFILLFTCRNAIDVLIIHAYTTNTPLTDMIPLGLSFLAVNAIWIVEFRKDVQHYRNGKLTHITNTNTEKIQ